MTAHSPCKRTAPFLHRTWLKGVKALQESSVMGNLISSPMHRLPHLGEADDDVRPTKRRRISSPDSLDVDHLVASPRMSESGSTLRIEVLKLFHRDSKKVKSYQGTVPRDVLTTKARCKITIFDVSSGAEQPQVLHCQSQLCDIITFKNPIGPHRIARIDLPRPFFVPHESILVNRPDDGGFDLSDSYQLVVEFESANAAHWPPLDSQDFEMPFVSDPSHPTPGMSQHSILSSKFESVYGRLKTPLNLQARFPSDQPGYQTNYLMDVDLRWTAGFKAFRRLEKGSKPCITAIDPDLDIYSDSHHLFQDGLNGLNGNINGHLKNEDSHDQDDDFAGDQTPSRSLRAREKNKIYNLKLLSDQALGRERKRRGRNASMATIEGRVQYVLPSDQPVSLDFYRCVSCGAYHESMEQLQLHFQTTHPAYQYELEITSQGPQFQVSLLRESSSSPQNQNFFQLGRSLKPFNLETLISGDQTWVNARLGPNDEILKSPTKSNLDRLQSGSPVSKTLKSHSRRLAKPRPKHVTVPDIQQPLFHPISKAKLKAGQEVPQNTPDDTWLIQKHREVISDFSDVTPAEKEYIWEWDGYILHQSITSAAYLPRAWLNFVKEKASWLVGAEDRMLEFAKHSSILLARDLLGDQHMRQAFEFVNEARAKKGNANNANGEATVVGSLAKDGPVKHSPRVLQIRKGANGCTVCQLPVLGPRLLVCSNTACTKRLYHADCIKHDAKISVTRPKWLCNSCSKSTGGLE